jgi:ribosomal protein S18 acetylase RimI-like enzyme
LLPSKASLVILESPERSGGKGTAGYEKILAKERWQVMKVEYQEISARDLDLIAPLWDKLRKHQETLSPHFSQHYANRTWAARRSELLETGRTGGVHIDLAKDTDSGQIVGYCVSTISSDRKGHLESIFVEPHCRGNGIGDILMVRAIEWMNSKKAQTIVLDVAVGNEAVISFYRRYGFYPRTIVLQQKT